MCSTFIFMTFLVFCLAILQSPCTAEPEFTSDPMLFPACGPRSECMIAKKPAQRIRRITREACQTKMQSAFAGITICFKMKQNCFRRTLDNGREVKDCRMVRKKGYYCNC